MPTLDGHNRTLTCDHEFAGRLSNRIIDLVREADPDDPHLTLVDGLRRRVDAVFMATDDNASVTFTDDEWPFVHGLASSLMFAGLAEYERVMRERLGVDA